ncbi:MAG: DUF2284 domain-containing protein [Candidatus Cloacimonetes bacterium]|nr:DUF2284 domain-containing protein [Candidatus Cloacimonadota bacterium]
MNKEQNIKSLEFPKVTGNSAEYIIKSVSISRLWEFHKAEEVHGYCQRCPKYGKFWSCPPLEFDMEQYIKQFSIATIVGVKIPLNPALDKAAALEHYQQQKTIINSKFLALESELSEAKVLIAGNCQACKSCTRPKGLPCLYPNKMRHSLEALGFKVSDICEHILNEKLQWSKDKMPSYLFAILAILSNEEIDFEKVRREFSPQREN